MPELPAALGDRYNGSPRPYPEQLPPLEYPGHFVVKRVTNAGTFRFKHRLLFIANALKQHHFGLEEIYCPGTAAIRSPRQRGRPDRQLQAPVPPVAPNTSSFIVEMPLLS